MTDHAGSTPEAAQRLGPLADALQRAELPACVRDSSGRYVAVNPAFAEMVGLDAARLLGKTDNALQPADVAERAAELDALVLQADGPLDTGEVVLARDGRRMVRACRFPVFDDDKPWAVCVVMAPGDDPEAGRAQREALQAATGGRCAETAPAAALAEAEAQREELERRLAEADRARSDLESRVAELHAEVEELRAGIEAARSEAVEAATRAEAAERERGEAVARAEEAERGRDEAAARADEARRARDEARARLSAVEAECAELRRRLREAETDGGESERALRALRTELDQAHAALEVAEVELEEARGRAHAAEAELQRARDRAMAAEAETAAVRRELEAVAAERDAHAQAARATESARAELAEQLTAERFAREQALAHLTELKEREARAADELAAVEAAREQAVAAASSLTAERAELVEERDRALAERDKLAAERDALAAERDELARRVAELEDRLAEALARAGRAERAELTARAAAEYAISAQPLSYRSTRLPSTPLPPLKEAARQVRSFAHSRPAEPADRPPEGMTPEMLARLDAALQTASSPRAAARAALGTLASAGGWAAGAVWRTRSDVEGLACMETWSAYESGLEAWETMAWRTHPEDGLVPAAVGSGEPHWADTDEMLACPRARAAAWADLGTLATIPARRADGHVMAVIELVRREHLPADPELLAALTDAAGRLAERLAALDGDQAACSVGA